MVEIAANSAIMKVIMGAVFAHWCHNCFLTPERRNPLNVDLQKAGLWKRIAAAILDFILLSIVAVGACWALTAALSYDAHLQHAESIKTAYEQEYGIPADIDYSNMTAEQQEAVNKANEALAKDPEAIKAISTMNN